MLARFTGKAGGVDDLHIAEYPGPLGIHDAPEIEKNIAEVLVERIVAGLTSRTTGATTKSTASADPRAIVFTGTAEGVNRHFIEQEWSDGLPVVAPTLERVERFLRHTDRSPDEEIAILPSANLRATPWNIAVNGVMAGLSPQHMPLLIAVVGVAGVLAFSVSGRTREFGIRLAIGSEPRRLVMGVIAQGAWMAGLGIVAGLACGLVLARLAGSYFQDVRMPGVLPVIGSALVLLAAAVVASILPATRAARVDVTQALRSD